MCQLAVPLSLFQLVLLGHQQFSKWYVPLFICLYFVSSFLIILLVY